MRMSLRLLAFAGAAAASLALASGALATQRLIVSASTIQVTEDKSDAAPLKITIYIATGFSATLGQAAGTQVGNKASEPVHEAAHRVHRLTIERAEGGWHAVVGAEYQARAVDQQPIGHHDKEG